MSEKTWSCMRYLKTEIANPVPKLKTILTLIQRCILGEPACDIEW